MKVFLMCGALICNVNGCAHGADAQTQLAGRWIGTVGAGTVNSKICLDFYRSGSGWSGFSRRQADTESISPLSEVRVKGNHIAFRVSEGRMSIAFEGSVTGRELAGTATAGTQQLSFAFHRTGNAPPLPFREEAVIVRNKGVSLDGRVLLPPGKGPHPAVVLIHGTGRQTWQEWRHYAQMFAMNGIAALLYDKRDVGHDPSGMDLVDLRDLAEDANAGINLLRARPDIRSSGIGVWGISQGGWVAPMVAAQTPAAFVIAVAAPGVTYADVNVFAVANRLRARGHTAAQIAEAETSLRRIDDYVRTGTDKAGVAAAIERVRGEPWYAPSTIPAAPPTDLEKRTWLRWRNLDLDPADFWKRVRAPVFLIYGDRDQVVPVQRSIDRITSALKSGGNNRAKAAVFAGASHEVTVAGEGGQVLAPRLADTMIQWAREQVGLTKKRAAPQSAAR